jgi:hypothetical protein
MTRGWEELVPFAGRGACWWCDSNELFSSSLPFLSLLLNKIQKFYFIFFLYNLILILLIATYFILYFVNYFFFFKSISNHLISFNFISNLVFILLIVIFFILFLIEFCFQIHPLTFDFNLFLYQIWFSFFITICFLFIIFYCLSPPISSPIIPYYFVNKNFTLLFFRVCLLWG